MPDTRRVLNLRETNRQIGSNGAFVRRAFDDIAQRASDLPRSYGGPGVGRRKRTAITPPPLFEPSYFLPLATRYFQYGATHATKEGAKSALMECQSECGKRRGRGIERSEKEKIKTRRRPPEIAFRRSLARLLNTCLPAPGKKLFHAPSRARHCAVITAQTETIELETVWTRGPRPTPSHPANITGIALRVWKIPCPCSSCVRKNPNRLCWARKFMFSKYN